MSECSHKWYIAYETTTEWDGWVNTIYVWKCDKCGVVENTIDGEPPGESE